MTQSLPKSIPNLKSLRYSVQSNLNQEDKKDMEEETPMNHLDINFERMKKFNIYFPHLNYDIAIDRYNA